MKPYKTKIRKFKLRSLPDFIQHKRSEGMTLRTNKGSVLQPRRLKEES